MRTIIDTHTHLYDLPDTRSALAECAAAGVSAVIALGVDLASNRNHLALKKTVAGEERDADAYPAIHLAFGLHPGNITTAEHTDACLAFLREHRQEAVAVGEIGLDYHYKWVRSDPDKQREQQDVFGAQLALAKEFALPAVIHSRGAYRESLDMTLAAGVTHANFHWYTGPLDVLKDTLDAGFFVSVSPSLEYSSEARAVAQYVPMDRILVETDTPVRGWKPQDVWRTLQLLSEIKGIPQEEALVAVNGNAQRFFRI